MATLFFNEKLLLKKAKGNPDKLVELLETYYKQKTNKQYISINLSGNSFILNPQDLFNCSSNTIYKSQYIILAAKRDYYLYSTYKITSLQLSFFPDLNIDKIKTNPLLTINKTEIKLKYEG